MGTIKNTASRGFTAVTLALCSGLAGAADFYGGLGVGQSKSGDYEDYVATNWDDGSIVAADFDDSDTGLRIFVGAAINPNFSLELAHLDLGEASTDAESDGSGFFYAAGPVKHSVSVDGLELSGLGRMPVSDAAEVFARLGFFKWDASEKIADSTGSLSGSDDGNDLFYAFGGEYRATPSFGLRLEYAFYTLDTAAGSYDVDMLSVSGAVRFGQ